MVEAFSVFIELGLKLTQLRKLCGFVMLMGRVHLSVVPRCPMIFSYRWSLSSGSRVLCVVSGGHSSVDVEALTCGVVAVGLGVRVWLDGTEASAPLLCELLPECGEGVAPRSQTPRPMYLGKA